MNIRIVKARHGWLWLVAGMRLLRAAPLQWLLLIGILFVASRVLFLLPLAPLLAVLVAPHFWPASPMARRPWKSTSHCATAI